MKISKGPLRLFSYIRYKNSHKGSLIIKSMKYFITDFASFYKKYSSEFPLGLKTVYGNLAPKSELKDFKPFFSTAFVVLAVEDETFIGAICTYACENPVGSGGGNYATNLFFYVKPAWRNTLVPGRLLKITETYCKNQGIKYYNWDVNSDSPLVPALEKRSTYKKISVVYRKEL